MKILILLAITTVVALIDTSATARTGPSGKAANTGRAVGRDTSGGGSGCMGEYMAQVQGIADWIQKKGSTLKPSVSSERFLEAADPNDVEIVPVTIDLKYKGNPISAFYEGSKIQLRCDRLLSEPPNWRKRTVAHEVLRKMGLEGDRYEISRQMFADSALVVCGVPVKDINYTLFPEKDVQWHVQFIRDSGGGRGRTQICGIGRDGQATAVVGEFPGTNYPAMAVIIPNPNFHY